MVSYLGTMGGVPLLASSPGVSTHRESSLPKALKTSQTHRPNLPNRTAQQRKAGKSDDALRMCALRGSKLEQAPFTKLRRPAGGACVSSVSGRCACLCRSARGAGAVGKMARVGLGAWVPCCRLGRMAVSFGFHRGLSTLLAPKAERAPRWLPACRQKTSISYLSRPDLPNLAYKRLKGKSPGIIFIPGYISNMNGTKALAIEEFCKSLGHAYIRFDYSGVGNSDGNLEECTVGKWRKDVLSIIDDLAEGPQILVGSSLGGWLMLHAAIARPQKVVALIGVAAAVDGLVTQFNQLPVEAKKEIEMKGVWSMPSKYSEEGVYRIQYSVIKEAEHHCLLHSPIPVNCPIRLLHGMKDDIVPWHTSMQVADRVVSTDVDVILRKNSDHRMKEKADIQLLVYTIDDLIDKLSTVVN
ncbi:palmitoyl-protein thioesterase ABHD10, mitochondrial [Eubalaena glacialis]|uniref:palmitoyl-protein thioesterase ABHD10, mitochondrial n=1 Tax=Eubalaena glacialis TaxID=27606 RepID=UPI002A5A4486|nr:palmitoyl-protein thioesterase ABHD10, mitochondrial [Eubalaena glacialis]